jgi:hypothetical protein
MLPAQPIPVKLPRPARLPPVTRVLRPKSKAPMSLRSRCPPKLRRPAAEPNRCTLRAGRPLLPTPLCSGTIV